MEKECKEYCCYACHSDCPNTELEPLGEPTIRCNECWFNTGKCEDCLLIHSEHCPKQIKMLIKERK